MAIAHPARYGTVDGWADAARGRSSLHADGLAPMREAAVRGAGPPTITIGPPEA